MIQCSVLEILGGQGTGKLTDGKTIEETNMLPIEEKIPAAVEGIEKLHLGTRNIFRPAHRRPNLWPNEARRRSAQAAMRQWLEMIILTIFSNDVEAQPA